MTDLDALHAALDAEPWSATLRLVIADELDALGDPLREGYRALGLLGLSPYKNRHFLGQRPWQWGPEGVVVKKFSVWAAAILPAEWCAAIDCPRREGTGLATYPTRREADDAAALAFARLPAATQAAILETAGASA